MLDKYIYGAQVWLNLGLPAVIAGLPKPFTVKMIV